MLLYAGASLVGAITRSASEARVTRAELPRVALVAIFGALIAPVLLAWGLGRTSGTPASLMLNLEALFTIALARALYREHIGRRVGIAALLLLAAGVLLIADRARLADFSASALGLLAVAGASLAWAFDNAFAKPLSELDPSAIVFSKGAIGAVLSLGLTFAFRDRWPSPTSMIALVIVGGVGYGASLRLYLKAQREIGAGRTASVFASGPFWGAGLALVLGEPGSVLTLLAAVVMILALVLHLTEKHAHAHVHEPVEHEHAHRHDDGHHDDHAHDPMPEGEHTHRHRHERKVHDHPHVPDLHHMHGHEHE